MSMLAEKKRRDKWCLNPRGKTWSDDQNKFGQRILEKMGWSAGQGLGINNQGPTEIVAVRKKDDNKGLGFKDNGEEWLKTTSDFNDLLDQLGSSMEVEGVQADITSSLEDRSKKSKARVHYHKFTRGKDLSRYSQKDLASIIGPVVVKPKRDVENDADYSSNQINKGSSEKYFNSKKKSRENNLPESNNYENTLEPDIDDKNNKKSRKGGKEETNGFGDPFVSSSIEIPSNQNRSFNYENSYENGINHVDNVNQVSKKNKKRLQLETEVKEGEMDQELSGNYETGSNKVSKKQKKYYNECENISPMESGLVIDHLKGVEDVDSQSTRKRKKRNKEKDPNDFFTTENKEESCENNEMETSSFKVLKKGQVLNGNGSVLYEECREGLVEENVNHENINDEKISFKRKNNKTHSAANTITSELRNEEHLDCIEKNSKRSKKKKKSKTALDHSILEITSNMEHIEEGEETPVKSSNTKTKHKKERLSSENDCLELPDILGERTQEVRKVKKKFKKEKSEKSNESGIVKVVEKEITNDDPVDEIDGCVKKKKKKDKN